MEETQSKIDLHNETDKIQFALELAIHEVTKNRKGAEGEDDPNESQAQIKQKRETKPPAKKGYLGTNELIKLPFVIGTPEYTKHPFAGVVFANTADEQRDLAKQEEEQIAQDKIKESK